jgi:molybdopterin synthase sulfur carrier subunit
MKILFFAGLREALGCSSETLPLPAGVSTMGELRQHLADRATPWSVLLTTKNLRYAVNQAMVGEDAPVADSDEVAFFPPVTGG